MTRACEPKPAGAPPSASAILRVGGPTALFDRVREGSIDPQEAYVALEEHRRSVRQRIGNVVIWVVTRTLG